MQLQIITPVRIVTDTEIVSVTLPTDMGLVTILPRHQTLLTQLQEGIITYRSGDESVDVAIGGGYAQTDGKTVRVLVSRAYGQDEINEKLTEEALANAQKILAESSDHSERAEAKTVLRRSIIDSKLIRRKRTSVSRHQSHTH